LRPRLWMLGSFPGQLSWPRGILTSS
jgi:hypothetical protein